MTNASAYQIWSGFTNPNQIDRTSDFVACDFLLLNALSVSTDNYEIAASVVIDVVADTRYQGGAIDVPQVALGAKEIPLNISYFDTALIVPLPHEASRSDCICHVCFATSYAVNIEFFAVTKKDLCECEELLERIKADLDFLKIVNSAIAVNQVAQDLAIAALATGIGGALAPYTAGGSLAIPGTVLPALSPGTGALIALTTLVGLPIPLLP
jgi:hypothetical protein